MTHWNHRVIKKVTELGTFYGIHEVFYNDDGSLWSCTENPVDVFEESLDDLRQTLEWMQTCLDKPILDYKDFPKFDNIDDIKDMLEFDSIDDLLEFLDNEKTD